MNLSLLKQIRMLLLDVDGVMTDGSIIYNDNNVETKVFNVKDGLGIRLLMDAGIRVGIVTGRSSMALTNRCKNLGITDIYDGIHNKAAVLDKIIDQTRYSEKEIAFVGDDLPDIALMNRVGLSVAVADAHKAVRNCAHIVLESGGGKGAVREISEAILKAKGVWDGILKKYC